MKKLLFLILLLIPTTSYACNKPLYLKSRVLQSELMVAALQCNLKPSYNNFILTHKQDLKLIGSKFLIQYGPKSNTIVTKIANDASFKSIINPNFCSSTSKIFKELTRTKLDVFLINYDC